MKRGRGILAFLLLLGSASMVHANVAIYVFRDDPQRARHATTDLMVSFAVWTAVILAGVWLFHSKRCTKFEATIMICLIATVCATYMTTMPNVTYVGSDRPPNYHAGGFMLGGVPGPKPEELKREWISPWMYGLALAVVISTAGLVVRQRYWPSVEPQLTPVVLNGGNLGGEMKLAEPRGEKIQ